jgi:hypothetical protein
VNTYLQGRKITIEQNHQPPPAETLRLIRKLRWIGMEEEAEQLQMQMQQSAPTGGVITVARNRLAGGANP